jgi:hypothetical protein
MARQLEKFVRARFAFLHAGPGMLRLIGLGIVIAGLGLMLPLPIPFSNHLQHSEIGSYASLPSWYLKERIAL